jgi:hypothetical protein
MMAIPKYALSPLFPVSLPSEESKELLSGTCDTIELQHALVHDALSRRSVSTFDNNTDCILRANQIDSWLALGLALVDSRALG